ncbi:hypothetical protein [Acidovorax sp. LjRoot129]
MHARPATPHGRSDVNPARTGLRRVVALHHHVCWCTAPVASGSTRRICP